MSQFLTTHGIAHHLEQIIKKADDELILLSPYFQLSQRFLERLKSADQKGVHVTIVYRNNKLKDGEYNKIKQLSNLKLYANDNLHAKCYLNHQAAIVTSMNMYEFSEKNNWEMGVLFEKAKSPDEFREVHEEVKEIIKISKLIKMEGKMDKREQEEIEEERIDFNPKQLALMKSFAIHYQINTRIVSWEKSFDSYGFGSLFDEDHDNVFATLDFLHDAEDIFHVPMPEHMGSEELLSCKNLKDIFNFCSNLVTQRIKDIGTSDVGHCLRDGILIPYNLEQPLGERAFKYWSKYSNVDYEESYCHDCGERAQTSVRKPQCRTCWGKSNGR